MKSKLKINNKLQNFMVLWSTQTLSTLGSSITSFALILWSYQRAGSALTTALLSVCSYVPYILMSIISGTISDKWNKKAILIICDSIAAICTTVTLMLLVNDNLQIWHLYLLNAINGFMNSLQQPASEVVTTLIVPAEYYQKISGLQSFSSSLTSILTPMIATALMSFGSMKLVIIIDLITFFLGAGALLFFVRIPVLQTKIEEEDSFFESVKVGLSFLKENKGILYLILFLAMINLTASMYNAALPALVLSKIEDGVVALGTVQTFSGLALVIGSSIAIALPKPENRVKVICITLFISMSTENFFLAFSNNPRFWCIGTILGWLGIPVMNANLNSLLREKIPVHLQGRVYAIRNAFQFFTIPIGYFMGGFLVDYCFEPLMKMQNVDSTLVRLFGVGKGSGASLLFLCLAILGISTCILFMKNREIWKLEDN